MILTGEDLTQVSFPLGGIGSGCIGLSGSGRLIDWEIFNQRSNKGSYNGKSHFALRAEKNGKIVDARILNGDITGNYMGEFTKRRHAYEGWGWGPMESTLAGMPHFKECVFTGEFPVARIDFNDNAFPGKVSLLAWSVFIPGDSTNSAIPAACFEIVVENNTADHLDYTTYGALSNPWCESLETTHKVIRKDGITSLLIQSGLKEQEYEYGDLTLSTDEPDVSWQEYWFRGGWRDSLEIYWRDLTTPGKFKNRSYGKKEKTDDPRKRQTGGVAAHFHLKPGESHSVRYIISWNSPNSTNDWIWNVEETIAKQGSKVQNRWKTWYSTVWRDSMESAQALWNSYDSLRKETFAFHDDLFSTTIPRVALDGISANLSILKTPTVLRMEDGTFYGWEGLGTDYGSCDGSCMHVWNYAQAVPLLFPDLERSMRMSHFKYSFKDESGAMKLRLQLPIGLKAMPEPHHSAADGMFGEAIKAYREWKVSGDPEWLKEVWPSVRKIIEFAWSPENPDQWDSGRTGVLTGRQHHTLDMELFGPNAWLTGFYLCALKAAAEMGRAAGDTAFAEECGTLFQKGRKWVDANLFNGEYYIQKIDLHDRSFLRQFKHIDCHGNIDDPSADNAYWNAEHGEIKYQIGNGCEIDMPLPQWLAYLCGLGEIYSPDHVHSTLNAIYKYNFVPAMRNIVNSWRTFSLNDESGTLICTWPDETTRPAIPLPYHQETMTGFEWAAAAQLIQFGELEKGLRIIEAIRNRYNGYRRNPWNEMECGSNYARAMASYGLLQSYSGFQYDMTRGMIAFAPVVPGDFKTFWSLGSVWGTYERTETEIILSIRYGNMTLRTLGIERKAGEIRLENRNIDFRQNADGSIVFDAPCILSAGSVLKIS